MPFLSFSMFSKPQGPLFSYHVYVLLVSSCQTGFLFFLDLNHLKDDYSVVLFVLVSPTMRLRSQMLAKIAQKWFALFRPTWQQNCDIEMSFFLVTLTFASW